MSKIIDFSSHPSDRGRIKEMATTYFRRNPRLVKSFIRDLAFLFAVIKPRYDYLLEQEPSIQIDQEKEDLEEIINNPVLLAKIIIIRENFPKQFELIQKNPAVLLDLEDNPNIIPDPPPEFTNLISSWPQFKQRHANPANFILLGGRTGTESGDEVDTSQYINYATSGDLENFQKALLKSPTYKRPEYLEKTLSAYNDTDDEGVKTNIAKSLVTSIHLVEDSTEKSGLIESALPLVEKDNGALMVQLSPELIQRWLKAIDDVENEEQIDKLISLQPYANSDESFRNRVWEAVTLSNLEISNNLLAKFGIFISSLLTDESFPDKRLIIGLFENEHFSKKVDVTAEGEIIGNTILSYVVNSPFSEEKVLSTQLLESIHPSEKSKKVLIEYLLDLVKSSDDAERTFAKEKLNRINLWPTDKNALAICVKKFIDYYDVLSSEEKNDFQTIYDLLKGEGSLRLRPISKPKSK